MFKDCITGASGYGMLCVIVAVHIHCSVVDSTTVDVLTVVLMRDSCIMIMSVHTCTGC